MGNSEGPVLGPVPNLGPVLILGPWDRSGPDRLQTLMFLCQTRVGERSRKVAVLDLNYALLEGFRLKNKPPSHGNCEHASCIARIILGNAARKFLNGRIGFGALGNWKRDAAAAAG